MSAVFPGLPRGHPESKPATVSTNLGQSALGLDTSIVSSASSGHSFGQLQILLCEFCNASFATPQGLKRHRDKTHLNKPAHVCGICGRGFMSKEHFDDHVNMHNKVKTHQCPHCSSWFTFKTCLRRHIRQGVCNKWQLLVVFCFVFTEQFSVSWGICISLCFCLCLFQCQKICSLS